MIKTLLGPLVPHLDKINNSKLFAGFVMVLLNIGSRYVKIDISKSQEQYLRKSLMATSCRIKSQLCTNEFSRSISPHGSFAILNSPCNASNPSNSFNKSMHAPEPVQP